MFKKATISSAVVFGSMLLINGCTVSQENFIKDADAFVQKTDATLPQFSKIPDPDGKFAKMVQKLLQDDRVKQAIYQDAVEKRHAWSSQIILEGDWFGKFLRRGVINLPLKEKQYLISLVRDSLMQIAAQYCASPRRSILSLTIPTSQIEHFLELNERAVKLGLTNTEKKSSTTAENIVAITAFLAKAKERYSDQELGEMLTSVVEKKTTAMCTYAPRFLDLVLELDPKYQETLFKLASRY